MIIQNFRGDGKSVEVIKQTKIGIMYRHPTLGICGARFDSMTKHERKQFGIIPNAGNVYTEQQKQQQKQNIWQ